MNIGTSLRTAYAPPDVREDVYIHLIKKMSALANGSFAFDVGRVPMDIFRYRIVLTCAAAHSVPDSASRRSACTST